MGAVDRSSPTTNRNRHRVLVCTDYFQPDATGGAERVAAEVAHGLSERDVTVHVLGAVPGAQPAQWTERGVPVRTVPAHDLSRLVGGQFAVGLAVWRALPDEIDRFRPDVVLTHSLHFHTSIAAAWFARRRGIPLITTVHVAGLAAVPVRLRAPTSAYEHSVGRWILHRSDLIIAVSDSVREHALHLGAPPDRVRVIPNGVDGEVFAPAEDADGTSTSGPLRITFVGRLIANKGPQVALAALAELARRGVPFRAAMVGDGPMADTLAAEAQSSDLGAMVDFVGTTNDVAGWLRQSDVFIRPSMTEGMPLAVLEAMACGLPVVGTDVPGNRDLIVNDVNGVMVPVGRPDRLADALQQLANDPARRSRLGQAALATARQHSWDQTASMTHAAIVDLVGHRR